MAFGLNNVTGLADGLLNSQSEKLISEHNKTEYIKYEMLFPSELNKEFSKEGIEELAEQIYADGLDQPLVVMQDDNGKYEILAGERRYLAIGKLIENNRWNDEHLVEVKVKKLDNSDLPLSKDDKKMLTWLSTNQFRNKTSGDKYIEAIRWKELILKLRKNGVNILVSGYDDEGNPITEDISGKKTRDIVAEKSNISSAQVRRAEYIDSHGTESLKDAVKSDDISIGQAEKIAALPEEKQEEAVENIISGTDEIPEDEEGVMTLTNDEFMSDIEEIIDLFDEDEIEFSDKEYKSYRNHIRGIIKLLRRA